MSFQIVCTHTYRAAVVSDNCNIRGWVALLCGCNHWIWKVPSPLTRPYLHIDISTGYIRVFPSVELTCNFKHSWQNTFHFPLYPDIIVGLALTSNKEKKNLKPFLAHSLTQRDLLHQGGKFVLSNQNHTHPMYAIMKNFICICSMSIVIVFVFVFVSVFVAVIVFVFLCVAPPGFADTFWMAS